MKDFAKLFTFPDIGQVLVVLDESETDQAGPVITTRFVPPGGQLGVCAIQSKFKDDDQGWESAELAFSMIDEDRVRKLVNPVIRDFTSLFEDRIESLEEGKSETISLKEMQDKFK